MRANQVCATVEGRVDGADPTGPLVRDDGSRFAQSRRARSSVAATNSDDPQSIVNSYFRREASYWADIYARPGIKESIHQERLRATLAFAAALRLPHGARAIDVGCGAGFATVGLARQGFLVEAIDSTDAMVTAARERAGDAGLAAQVTTRIGDVHALPFADATFDLVVALGVLPWLPAIDAPLREMSRVLRPDGHIIVTVDTLWQLRHLFDPLASPLTRTPRRWASRLLRRSSADARAQVTTLRALRRALAAHGLTEVAGRALGFGPFTLFKHEVLPRTVGMRLQDRLQSLANRGVPLLRSTGSQYLVLAQKRRPDGRAPDPLDPSMTTQSKQRN